MCFGYTWMYLQMFRRKYQASKSFSLRIRFIVLAFAAL